MAELIDMPFATLSLVCPRNRVLHRIADAPRGSGTFSIKPIAEQDFDGFGKRVNCAKMGTDLNDLVRRASTQGGPVLGHLVTAAHLWGKSTKTSSAVAEMGDCDHNRHGSKRGAPVPLHGGSWVPI